jgi:hypothetical protein
MIKLSLAKRFGIKFVGGDMVTARTVSGSAAMISRTVATYFNGVAGDDSRSIESFATRLISDGIPISIDGDVVLELTNGKGLVSLLSARNAAWHVWTTWRPSMEWLMQQAEDKPVQYKDDAQFFGEDIFMQTAMNLPDNYQIPMAPQAPKVPSERTKAVLKEADDLSDRVVYHEVDTKSAIHKAWVDLNGKIDCDYYDWLALWHVTGGDYRNGEYYLSHSKYCHETGAKFVCTANEFKSYCECMSAEEKRMDIIGQNGNDGLHYDNAAQQVEALAVNVQRQIFTQAMADAGELPPVGSKFLGNMDIQYITVGYTTLGSVVGEVLKSGSIHTYKKNQCKPIDTRTEKQKEVELALAEWPTADKSTLEFAYDYWLSGRKQ